MKKKEALKRKAEPEDTGKQGQIKRRKKEWWDKLEGQKPAEEEDDDVEQYRKEVGESSLGNLDSYGDQNSSRVQKAWR